MFVKLLSLLYAFYLYLKGPRKIKLVSGEKIDLGELRVTSVKGFKLYIYCKELRYLVKHKHWYVPNYHVTCYEMHAQCTTGAPQRLVDATKDSVWLPPVTPTFLGLTVARRRLVDSYLDILISRLSVDNEAAMTRSPLFGDTDL
jgi:hypothetical protein